VPQVIEQLDQEDKLVLLSGVNLSVSALLLKASWFLQMVSDGKVFATYMDALASVDEGKCKDEEDDIELTKIVDIHNF
jgi:sulfur transfer complex TusBCD TusB component (DsrH family)